MTTPDASYRFSRDDAEHIAADPALRYWTPDAAQLPRVEYAYPR